MILLVGNSSSGIHETASFKVPVINIGSRQEGRMKPKNVINVTHDFNKILSAIKKGMSNNFKKKIKRMKNPYGDGNSAKRIIKIINKINFSNFKTQKKLTY